MRISSFLSDSVLSGPVLFGALIAGSLLAGSVVAAPESDAAIRQALTNMAPNFKIDSIQESPVPGFSQVVGGGQIIYVSNDGRFLFDGNAYDVVNKKDLSETGKAKMRLTALSKIGDDKRIVFTPAKPRHTITVFTDVDCPYCRRFHEQIAQYNANGIAVDYLFYPLSIHPGADKKAEAVWCAKDRNTAFTNAMAGQDTGKATCPNPVSELTKLAEAIGVTGTPTILASDGTQIQGDVALSPDRLAAELDRMAQANAAKN
ncbi:MAG: DsbC family protein [Dokdonella sp.]